MRHFYETKLKRGLSAFLAFLMIIGMFPMEVFANENVLDYDPDQSGIVTNIDDIYDILDDTGKNELQEDTSPADDEPSAIPDDTTEPVEQTGEQPEDGQSEGQSAQTQEQTDDQFSEITLMGFDTPSGEPEEPEYNVTETNAGSVTDADAYTGWESAVSTLVEAAVTATRDADSANSEIKDVPYHVTLKLTDLSFVSRTVEESTTYTVTSLTYDVTPGEGYDGETAVSFKLPVPVGLANEKQVAVWHMSDLETYEDDKGELFGFYCPDDDDTITVTSADFSAYTVCAMTGDDINAAALVYIGSEDNKTYYTANQLQEAVDAALNSDSKTLVLCKNVASVLVIDVPAGKTLKVDTNGHLWLAVNIGDGTVENAAEEQTASITAVLGSVPTVAQINENKLTVPRGATVTLALKLSDVDGAAIETYYGANIVIHADNPGLLSAPEGGLAENWTDDGNGNYTYYVASGIEMETEAGVMTTLTLTTAKEVTTDTDVTFSFQLNRTDVVLTAEEAYSTIANITRNADFLSSLKTVTVAAPRIVTFDANGHGTAPAEAQVAYGSTVTKPEDPTETGYKFDGWYTEAQCTNEFNFATAITAKTTLYAKWTLKPTDTHWNFKVSDVTDAAKENGDSDGTAWYYNDVRDAFAAAAEEATITLLHDYTLMNPGHDTISTMANNLIFDLDGHKYTLTDGERTVLFAMNRYDEEQCLTVQNGTIDMNCTDYYAVFQFIGEVISNNVNYINSKSNTNSSVFNDVGTVIINGGSSSVAVLICDHTSESPDRVNTGALSAEINGDFVFTGEYIAGWLGADNGADIVINNGRYDNLDAGITGGTEKPPVTITISGGVFAVDPRNASNDTENLTVTIAPGFMRVANDGDNSTVYPHKVVPAYRVKLNAGDGTITGANDLYKDASDWFCWDKTVTSATLPQATRAGYNFNGWYEGDMQYTTAAAANGKTLVAKWTVNEEDGQWVAKVSPAPQNAADVENGVAYYTTLAAAINDAATDSIVTLLTNYTATDEITLSGKKITLTAANVAGQGATTYATLTAKQNTRLFTLDSGADVTLTNITLKGSGTVDGDGGAFYLNSGASLTLGAGATLQNFNQTGGDHGGGAIYSAGTLTMKPDAVIKNCTAGRDGGAIFVDSYSAFNMTGGEIFGNHTDKSGGGIASDSGNLTISGGEIYNNASLGTAGNNYGGAIAAWKYSGDEPTVTISGTVEIYNNTAKNRGGGISIDGGTLTMNGGTISGCSAPNSGGVYVLEGGTFTMTGGTISGCSATTRGGGVYNEGKFTMHGGEITGCTITGSAAPLEGAGVFNGSTGSFTSAATFTMTAGKITNCTVTSNGSGWAYGGGVANGNRDGDLCGKFTMSGGEITGCEAKNTKSGSTDSSAGGGVANLCGEFTMTGGTISGCKAAKGGGVCNDSFDAIHSQQHSGLTDNKVTVTGGTITGNTATVEGGGIRSNRTVVVTGGTITHNTAPTGGGVCVNSGSISVGGGATITGNTDNKNVYVKSNCTFGLASSFNGTVGVSSATAANNYFNAPFGASNSKTITGKITNDTNALLLGKVNGDNLVWGSDSYTLNLETNIKDGQTPYWYSGADGEITVYKGGKLTLGETVSRQAYTNLGAAAQSYTPTNIGWKLEGWYTEAEGGTKVDTLTKLNNAVGTNESVTLYAHWVRDNTAAVWNATTNTLYRTTTTDYLKTAIEEAGTSNVVFLLRDVELTGGATYINNNGVKIDGGVYHYDDDAATGKAVLGGTDTTYAKYGDKTRYTIAYNTNVPGHAIEYGLNGNTAEFRNLVITRGTLSGRNTNNNGLIWLNKQKDGETITLTNVELFQCGYDPNQNNTALIGCAQGTANIELDDCYLHGNTSMGGVFVAGKTYTNNTADAIGDIIVTVKGSTTIEGNYSKVETAVGTVDTLMNVKIVPSKNGNGVCLRIDETFSGHIGVYLPDDADLNAALCKDFATAKALIDNDKVTSDQSYELEAVDLSANPVSVGSVTYAGAIRVSKQATYKYDLDDGTGAAGVSYPTDPQPTKHGDPITLPAAPTKDGYSFKGWKINDDTTLRDPGWEYTVDADTVTITAVWQENVAKVNAAVDATGGIIVGNETYFASLKAAVEAVNGMGTTSVDDTIITLLAPEVTLNENFTFEKPCTLDLNDKTLKFDTAKVYAINCALTIKNGNMVDPVNASQRSLFNIPKTASGIIKLVNVNMTADNFACIRSSNVTVQYNGGVYNVRVLLSEDDGMTKAGTVEINANDGEGHDTYMNIAKAWYFHNLRQKTVVKINGGYFTKKEIEKCGELTGNAIDIRDKVTAGHMWIDLGSGKVDKDNVTYQYQVVSANRVKLDAKGGTFSESDLYKDTSDFYCYTDTLALPTATRTGYTFDGWYLSTDTSYTTQITTADNTHSGKTLVAKWTVDETSGHWVAKVSPAPSGAADVEGNEAYYTTLKAAVNAAPTNSTVTLLTNTTDGGITVNKNVTLDLNNHYVECVGSASMFTVSAGTFTLTDNSTTKTDTKFKQSSDTDEWKRYWVKATDGTKTVTGGYLLGNANNNNDGLVVVTDGGTFTMNGGTIVGNKNWNGGWRPSAVWVENGTFNLNGGAIKGCNGQSGAIETRWDKTSYVNIGPDSVIEN